MTERDTSPEYIVGHVHQMLAEDPRVNEPSLQVLAEEGAIIVEGPVTSEERKRLIPEVIAERYPDLRVENNTHVIGPGHPAEDT